ncbi:MAG: hypothetical protein ACFB51_16390 [Anaerolineae bacterium]
MKHGLMKILLLAAAALACNAPVGTPEDGPTPDATAAVDPTASITPQQDTDTPAAPEGESADFDDYIRVLAQQIRGRDFDALEEQVGDAFLLSYAVGDTGQITPESIRSTLETDFLSGSEGATLVPNTDPTTLTEYETEAERTVFSRGWGPTGNDEALLFLSLDAEGQPYWSGMLYARGGFAARDDAAEGNPTRPPNLPTEPGATPNPPSYGEVQYETSFGLGWPDLEFDTGEAYSVTDGYRIDAASFALWTFTTQASQASFYAEITAEPQTCPERAGQYGILFHYEDSETFRALVVTCSGRWAVYERRGENVAPVIAEGALPGNLHEASGEHRIGVLAVGTTLTLYVDDVEVGTAAVDALVDGDFGPYVQTDDVPFSVVFSRLIVANPTP